MFGALSVGACVRLGGLWGGVANLRGVRSADFITEYSAESIEN